jgi:hypothetical protein
MNANDKVGLFPTTRGQDLLGRLNPNPSGSQAIADVNCFEAMDILLEIQQADLTSRSATRTPQSFQGSRVTGPPAGPAMSRRMACPEPTPQSHRTLSEIKGNNAGTAATPGNQSVVI